VIPRRQCSGAQAHHRSRGVHTMIRTSTCGGVQSCGRVGERRAASEAAG